MRYADSPTVEATVHVAAPPARVWPLVRDIEWETVSEVVECDEERSFAWAVMDPANPTALWRFTLTPVEGGTELRQWVRMGPGPSFLSTIIERMPDKEERIVAGRLREWQQGIGRTLAGIKHRAEA